MLFNSYLFLFGFLPVALAGYEMTSRLSPKLVIAWLGLCSLVFYAWWQPSLLFILIGSIGLNYLAAALISRRIPSPLSPRKWVYLAVTANLLLLAYYKYLFPSLNSISRILATGHHWTNVALPLGISFFTLTQIAYLVDLYKGSAKQQNFSNYLLFVTFFPHLIAGPILHHGEIMPQLQGKRFGIKKADFTVGLTWFVFGLAKKVLLADQFANTANPVFMQAGGLTTASAWLGALAYALQLYFDFSGYSDMALGLARMFAINFPLNFNSPYKASSMIDAWQRWHMTLGRYIFTYIFNPIQRKILKERQRRGLGITRQDRGRPAVFVSVVAMPLIFTLFVAGVWHGAGLQFMVFGLLHGVYLSVNHAWRLFRQKARKQPEDSSNLVSNLKKCASVLTTFLCVLVSLVFFRADSVGHALSVLGPMIGIHSGSLHPGTALTVGTADSFRQAIQIGIGLVIIWGFPNTQQILTRFKPSLEKRAWNLTQRNAILQWQPSPVWSFAVTLLLFACLIRLKAASTFLYFQF